LSQLMFKVTVTSSRYYIKCSMCPPCCWRCTQAGDAIDRWRDQ